jgi:hypothetical protein
MSELPGRSFQGLWPNEVGAPSAFLGVARRRRGAGRRRSGSWPEAALLLRIRGVRIVGVGISGP